jgi:hypothetical protein
MVKYATTWKDYCLPQGEAFAVAVCSYNGRVRHMTIGRDPIREKYMTDVTIDGEKCSSEAHCLALECPLNHTEHEHLAHMLDIYIDEPADQALVNLWGKDTVVDCFVEMARKISESLAQAKDQNK